MTATLSGSELIIVALALIVLALMAVSSFYGILARLTRGRVQRRSRWWHRRSSSTDDPSN